MSSTPQPSPSVQPAVGGAGLQPVGDAAASLRASLSRLRVVTRLMLIWQTLGWLVAVYIAGGIAVAITDYFLRLPGWLRGGFLGLGVAIALWIIRTRVIPAARFGPSLTEYALRLERTATGAARGLGGLLASAIDLSASPVRAEAIEGRRLAGLAAERLRGAGGAGLWSALRPARSGLATAAAAATLVALGVAFARSPELARIGVARIMAPWMQAQWPVRTAVADATGVTAHPLGTALALRGALVRSDLPAAQTRVEARYRIIAPDGTPGPFRKAVLTSQERPVETVSTDALGARTVVSGTLFERLIEPGALEPAADGPGASAPADPTLPPSPARLEYTLATRDGETAPATILLVRPPAIVSASAVVTPPPYAGAAPLTSELGTGADERATLSGVLTGSRVEVRLSFNRPLPPAPQASGDARRAWLAAALGEQFAALVADRDGPEGPAFAGVFEGASWRLSWTVRDPIRLVVRPRDEHGIAAEVERVFRIQSRDDTPPEATVSRPADAGEALATATLPIACEGRDDIGLEWVRAQYQIARRPPDSAGAPPEPAGEPATLADAAQPAGAQPARTLTATGDLALASLSLKPGDEVWISALAKDRFELDGRTHEPVRSAIRVIRIISPDELVEQVWKELGSVRRGAIRAAEQQAGLRQAASEGRESPTAAREQESLTEAAARQARTLDQVRARVRDNALKDDDLDRVLDQARRLAEEARQASADAAAAARRAAEAAQGGQGGDARAPERDQARKEADAARQQSQQALEDLASVLDQGEDAWSVRRGVERLLEEQRAIREQTRALGEQTVGRSIEELTAAQRQQAGQLAERQSDLSQRTGETVEKLRQQAEAMRQQDPSTAGALDEAARRAERARVQEQMDRAAREIEQNRQQSAQQQQDRAVEAMEQMLQDMQAAAKGRDEVLARELASLVESLDGLIRRQERELAALAAAAPDALAALDAGMIALRANTLGVLDQARAAGREAREVGALIDAAAGSQADAIAALRQAPPSAAGARTGEEASLERLKEARAKAESARQAAEDRNARRERDELRKAYRGILDAQIDVRDRTKDAAALEAGRRQRAAARELVAPQDDVRRRAADLLAKTQDLGESDLFRFAHDRLDEATGKIALRLNEGEASPAVVARQNMVIRILQGIIESLGQAGDQDDNLREPGEGDEGGDSSGQPGGQQRNRLIPESAELRLLRDQQAQALELTRAAAEGRDAELAGDAAALQKGLFEKARALLERLQRQQPGAPTGRPAGDDAGAGEDAGGGAS